MQRSWMFPLLLAILVSVGLNCGKPEKPPSRSDVPELRFKPAVCMDNEGTGIEAFRVLIPADWTFSSYIRWNIQNPGMPAVAGMQTTSPDGLKEVNVFPNQSFFWTDNPMTRSMFPPGSRYFGAEVRPLMHVGAMLRTVALPRFRRNARKLRIVREDMVPELVRAAGLRPQTIPGGQSAAEGGKIRVEYSVENRTMEEDLYGIVESYGIPLQTMTGRSTNTMWTAEFLFSVRAATGSLDSSGQLFRIILGSFRINPKWFGKYAQVVSALIRANIQQIHRVGELSRIISQTSNQISDEMMHSYEERQSVYDRLADDFCHHIRDVDAYYDPVQEREVELPAGYTQAWTNPLGEYVVSEKEDFNPNVGSNLHWERMEKK